MSDLLLEVARMELSQIRELLALARNRGRNAKTAVEDREHAIREGLLAAAGGNPKELGSNEQLREDRYRSAYGQDAEWVRSRATWLDAQDQIEILEAVLNGRIDRITADRLKADERRTDALGRLAERGLAVPA